jgi:hypothetical protein
MENTILNYFDIEITNPNDKPKEKCVKLEHGLKLICSKFVLDNINSEKYIQDNFKLSIKKLENDFYSVYFHDKNT